MVFSGVLSVAKQVERFHLLPVFPYLQACKYIVKKLWKKTFAHTSTYLA